MSPESCNAMQVRSWNIIRKMHALCWDLVCDSVLTLYYYLRLGAGLLSACWSLALSRHAVSWPLASVSVLTLSSPRLTTGPLSASWTLYPSQPRTYTLIKLLRWKSAPSVQIYGMGIFAARRESSISWDMFVRRKCSSLLRLQHLDIHKSLI